MFSSASPKCLIAALLTAWLFASACAPNAPRLPAQPQEPNSAVAATTAPLVPRGSVPPTPSLSSLDQPTLLISPAVDLKVGTAPIAAAAPFFIAHSFGYFQEVN